MLVEVHIPLIAGRHNPLAEEFVPLSSRPALVPELTQGRTPWGDQADGSGGPLRLVSLTSEFFDTEARYDPLTIQHFVGLHPYDACRQLWQQVRDGNCVQMLRDRREARAEEEPLTIPGQVYHGLTFSGPVLEGVAVVYCSSDEWARETEDEWLSSAPRLIDIDTGKPAGLPLQRGSYVSDDGRALIVTIDDYFDVHGDHVYTAHDETSGSTQQLALANARRSYDVLAAARLVDELHLHSARGEHESLRKRLRELRELQVSIASRRLATLLDTGVEWQAESGDDAFKLSRALRRVTHRLDAAVSGAFQDLLPVLEAGEAELRLLSQEAQAQQRDEQMSATEAERRKADRERRSRQHITEVGATLLGGVSVLGLFAAFAAIPEKEVALEPSTRAGFVTIALATALALIAALLQALLPRRVHREGWRVTLRVLSGTLALGVLGGAVLGSTSSQESGVWLLVTLLGTALLALLFYLFSRRVDEDSAQSSSAQ